MTLEATANLKGPMSSHANNAAKTGLTGVQKWTFQLCAYRCLTNAFEVRIYIYTHTRSYIYRIFIQTYQLHSEVEVAEIPAEVFSSFSHVQACIYIDSFSEIPEAKAVVRGANASLVARLLHPPKRLSKMRLPVSGVRN